MVHTNAAYCRLTGIDSHIVAGKPISFLLSLQKDSTGTLSRLDDTQQAEGLTVAVPTNYTPGDPLTIEANGLVRAEANGRARAEASMNPRKEYSLERLIATSGFGHIHVVHVNTRPFQMVGRDVTILKEVIPSSLDAGMHSRNEEVNCTSVASGFEGGQVQHPPISCRISIAPIISSTNSCDSSVVMTDQEAESHPKGKRAKHHFGTESNFQQRPSRVEMSIQHCKYQPLQFARYFVIQLQALSDTTETTNGMESLSSNSKSVEANLLGLTKEGLMLQRHIVATGAAAASPQPAEAANLLEDADVEADAEASTEGEAVAALG